MILEQGNRIGLGTSAYGQWCWSSLDKSDNFKPIL